MPPDLRVSLLDNTSTTQYGTLESPRGHVELMHERETRSASANVRAAQYSGVVQHGATSSSPGYQRPAPTQVFHVINHQRSRHRSLNVSWSPFSHGLCCAQCVRTQELGIVEYCGAFDAIVAPGLHLMCWPIHTISGRLSLRLQQLDITCQTMSLDRVFVCVTVSLFYRVSAQRSFEAFYSMQDPQTIIKSCVLDAIQSIAPCLSLDDLYASKARIAEFCYDRLGQHLLDHGYETNRILVKCIEPTKVIRDAMDEVAASRVLKRVAAHTAEANKIEKVKKAEADAERHYLMGVAVAKARQVISDQMKESAALFSDVDVRIRHPPSTSEILKILLVAQYMDVLEVVKPEQIMIEAEPEAFNAVRESI